MPFSLKEYFKIAGNYLLTSIVAGGLTYILCDICLTGNSWVLFLIRIVICCIAINLIIILFYRKTDKYQYFMMLVKKVLKLSR